MTVQVFDEETKETIEHTRTICDLKSLLLKMKEKGSLKAFWNAAREVADMASTIDDEEIIKSYRKFLCKLETYYKDKDIKVANSRDII